MKISNYSLAFQFIYKTKTGAFKIELKELLQVISLIYNTTPLGLQGYPGTYNLGLILKGKKLEKLNVLEHIDLYHLARAVILDLVARGIFPEGVYRMQV